MRRWLPDMRTVRRSNATVSNRAPGWLAFYGVTRWLWLALLLSSICAGSGCATVRSLQDEVAYNDQLDRWATGVTSCLHAHHAWYVKKGEHADEPHLMDFGAGFRQGYVAVARGGDGCPPTLPPRRYWNYRFERPEGQRRIAAWFTGYPYGVLAAAEYGAGVKQRVPSSASIQGRTDSFGETAETAPAEPVPVEPVPVETPGDTAGSMTSKLPPPAPAETPSRPDSRPQFTPDASPASDRKALVPSGRP